MSEIKTITIPTTQLPNSRITYGERGYGRGKFFGWHSDGLQERSQIHENTAQALKELQKAQEELQKAEERVESLRMFARELYATPSLKVVNE